MQYRYTLLAVVVLAVVIAAWGGGQLQAQTITASLTGTVQDPSGASVPGARVVVTHAATGESREVSTANDGRYVFFNLAPGEYALQVSAQGFKTKIIEKIVLQVDQKARLDVLLEVGSVAEIVEVVGRVALVNTESATIGEVIELTKVVELPLNGRQFMELALLTPGTTPWHGGHSQLRGGGPRGVGVNIAGRDDYNNYLIDGIESFGYRFKNTTIRPSIEVIEEFKVGQAPYDVRFGTGGTGQINLITRSGTKDFHGSIYEFLRNDVFDARNFFNIRKPPYRQNQFGGVVGGPIAKEKAFFLFNYEGLRVRRGLAAPAQVPTTAQRNGDFSGDPVPILDPVTFTPFPGNIIPSSRIHPVSGRFLKFYPLPNTGLAAPNFINSESEDLEEDQFTIRVDYSISPKWKLFGRYTWQDTERFTPAGIPAFGIINKLRGQNFASSAVYSASPTFLMEIRLGYNRENAINSSAQVGKRSVSEFGIPGLNPPADVDGVPSVSILGFAPIGDAGFAPEARVENSENLVVDFTKIKGHHTLIWGTFIRPAQLNRVFVVQQQRGSFNFINLLGGSTGLPSFLLGFPFITQRTFGLSRADARGWAFAFYGMDTFRMGPRLTLTYGLRYEFRQPWVDEDNTIATIVDGQTQIAGDPNNGFTGRRNRSLYGYTLRNFEPRLSLAFDPLGNAKTVIRAGYGIYSSQVQFNGANFIGTLNPPVSVTEFYVPLAGFLTWDNAFPSAGFLAVPPIGIAIKPDFRDPLIQHWSLSIQRELFRDLALEIAYVGNKGTNIDSVIMLDQGGPPGSRPGTTPYVKPFPRWTVILEAGDRNRSIYHSLQSKVTKRLSHGLTMLFSYTYSHLIDLNGGFNAVGVEYSGFPQDSRNLRAERASSNIDIKHRAVVSTIYYLPLGPGKRWGSGASGAWGKFLQGWGISGIWTLQTGFPLTPNVAADRSNTLGLGDRPNCLSDPVPPGFRQTRERWFDTSAFQRQAPGTFGTCGRNVVRGPGLNNFDFNIFKNTYITETKYIQFRAELFNIWNHTNFNNPGMTIDSPVTFGVITSAKDPRIIQFGLKFVF